MIASIIPIVTLPLGPGPGAGRAAFSHLFRGAKIAFADRRRCFHVVQTHAFAFRRPEVRSPLAHY